MLGFRFVQDTVMDVVAWFQQNGCQQVITVRNTRHGKNSKIIAGKPTLKIYIYFFCWWIFQPFLGPAKIWKSSFQHPKKVNIRHVFFWNPLVFSGTSIGIRIFHFSRIFGGRFTSFAGTKIQKGP